MNLTVTVAGDGERDVHVSPDHGGPVTYGDVIEAVGLSRHEATALVDAQPVPADRPVTDDHPDGDAPAGPVTVLRLISGG